MTAPLSTADHCRQQGWGPGTVLTHPRGGRIRITAVGEDIVLARSAPVGQPESDEAHTGLEQGWLLDSDWSATRSAEALAGVRS